MVEVSLSTDSSTAAQHDLQRQIRGRGFRTRVQSDWSKRGPACS